MSSSDLGPPSLRPAPLAGRGPLEIAGPPAAEEALSHARRTDSDSGSDSNSDPNSDPAIDSDSDSDSDPDMDSDSGSDSDRDLDSDSDPLQQ
jgi:hypothetical protein